jgi:outer membrane protein OmpA-like peptidoglycan-associated protein
MKKLIVCFSLLAIQVQINAQSYLGLSSSNYAGVIGNQVNPANFVDGRYKFDLLLFGTNMNIYQNFGYFDANAMRSAQGGEGYWWYKSFSDAAILNAWSKPDETFIDRFIVHNYDETSVKTLGANINFQVDVLNTMFHINEKTAIGFNVRNRTVANVDNMDPKLAVLAEDGLEHPSLWNATYNEQLFNVNYMTWSEVGFNYSQVLIDNKEHFLKIGFAPKVLLGHAAAYVHTDDFSYNLVNEDTSQYLTGTFDYGYSNNINGIINNGMNGQDPTISDLIDPASKLGFGLDIGAVYEYRPKYAKFKYDMDGETDLWRRNENKYKLRAGLSIVDMGSMKFTKGGLSRNFAVNTSNLFNLQTFNSATSLEGFDGVIDSLIQQSSVAGNQEWVSLQDPSETFRMRTPTAVSFQFDYQIWKGFYINATSMVNLISQGKDTKVKTANQFSITPSFDSPYFGVYMPISMNQYSGMKYGLATRIGPLVMGITDMKTIMAKDNVSGVEFYFGSRIPIIYHRVRDKDNDKVSNKKDECKDVPGIWAFKGCPDTDNDGIPDSDDDCINEPGTIEFKGCPDTDGDKIIDKKDACPTVAGLKEYKGCPDTDGDKIIDSEDACPTVAGLKEYKGCPDTDGDKIIDSEDVCPTVAGLLALKGCPDRDADGVADDEDACPDNAGPKENKGCPDKDADGIYDFIDECPDVAGPQENRGCPYKDTDGDKILDKDDDCPTLAGPSANKGCPYKDSDQDGLLDKDDDCPNTPGPKSNNGCPVIEQAVIEVLKTAFDNLEFEVSKDVILEGSKVSLSELAEVLKKKPTWKLEITGHTDSQGDDTANMLLSKKRAEAVKAYLVSQGIDASRFITLYYGETKPISTNETAEGRQKNRRVEMKVVFD